MKVFIAVVFCFLLLACGQEQMKQSNLDLPTVSPVATATTQAAAPAITTITNGVQQLDFSQFVPCAADGSGEDVHLTGQLHMVIRVTINGNKIGIKTQTNPQGVRGIGLVSGDLYRGTGVTQEVSNENVSSFPEVETFINNFRIIGQRKENNLLIHENAHLTINANGTTTVFHDNFTLECK